MDGEFRRVSHPPVKADELPVYDLNPGDEVEFTFGRYRGGKGRVEEIQTLPTPSGRQVRVARVTRPRAGETWEFPCCLKRIDPAASGG